MTTSAISPRTATKAQPLPPAQVSDLIHGSIDVGGVGVASVGTGLGWPGWYQPPPPQRSQGVQGSSSVRPTACTQPGAHFKHTEAPLHCY